MKNNLLFGVHADMPLRGFPPGRARIRMRNDAFVVVYVKDGGKSIRAFHAKEVNGHLEPMHEFGANVRRVID